MRYVTNLFEHYRNYYAYGRLVHLKYAGIVGAIGYPLFYLIYRFPLHQPYENLGVRLVATVACLLLALQDRWLGLVQKYYLPFSYFVVLYCLPFFHVFMALKNHGGMVMIADSFMAVFFLVLLTDWRNTLAMIILGAVGGTLAYVCSTEMPTVPMDYVQRLPTFILVVIGGSLFKHSEKQTAKRIEDEKLSGMSSVVATIAHEMRTPLVSINSSARGLHRYVPILMHEYESRKTAGLVSEPISQRHLAGTVPAIDRIIAETVYMNGVIDLLLANAAGHTRAFKLADFPIESVITKTLELYPFESDKYRAMVSVELHSTFMVHANEDIMRNVLINLIKNSLKAVIRAGKGAIQIRTDGTPAGGRLYVRDTGTGIPTEEMPHIFKRFHSYPANSGTGIGLAFCMEALAAWGSKISCDSQVGEYTEFLIEFPPV